MFLRVGTLAVLAIASAATLQGDALQAAVVSIDLSAYSGVNGGIASNSTVSIEPLTPGSSNRLDIVNMQDMSIFGIVHGLSLQSGSGGIAGTGASARPIAFGAGATIDATAGGGSYHNSSDPTNFKGLFGTTSPAFAPNSFLGFQDSLGRFGYIEIEWNGVDTFKIISGAYESVAGVAIQTPGGGGEVPEPASMAIFGLGALGFAYRNRRKLIA